MNQIYVRPAEQRDAASYAEWCKSNPHFDSSVLTYPATQTLAAYNQSGAIAFMPLAHPVCMDAIAFRPGLLDAEKALAMKELTKTAVFLAHSSGAGEVMFLGSNEGTNQFARNHIFEELPWKVYRVRVRTLESL